METAINVEKRVSREIGVSWFRAWRYAEIRLREFDSRNRAGNIDELTTRLPALFSSLAHARSKDQMDELNLDFLTSAVSGNCSAIRIKSKLEPVGGAGDKIFPPTFGDEVTVPQPMDANTELRERNRRTKYALEWRRIEGRSVLCVLLDSVASQANRMELALLDAWNEERIKFPLLRVDFSNLKDDDPTNDLSSLGGDGFLTALEMPHRIADAILRDSMMGDLPFRASKQGIWYTEASPQNATAVYALCPTALIFGVWDSTGPKGGLGSKFQRALSSEIMGVGVELGVKTASRIDPAGIQHVDIFKSASEDGDWTTEVASAKKEKGKPVPFSRGSKENTGKPSVINHGNIKPGIESLAGGVTVDYAEQVSVLSLPALRRLRFPENLKGEKLSYSAQREAELVARTSLAALGLAALVVQRRNGFDLRSRCALRPLELMSFEFLSSESAEAQSFSLSQEGAAKLVLDAMSMAEKHGMAWNEQPIDLAPAPKMVDLIRKARNAQGS